MSMTGQNLFWPLFAAGVLLLLYWLAHRLLRACEAANKADWGNRWTNRIAGFVTLFCHYVHHFKYDVIPLPTEGGAVVAANHISGLDPLLLVAASPRPLRFLIAREEYERFGLRWLFRRANCIPVDRERKPERALREAIRALQNGEVVAVFPQGGIHLETDVPRKIKGGVVRLAHQMDCCIFPLRVSDVRGAGYTALALIMPGRATLRAMPVLDCEDRSHDDCLNELMERLALHQG